MDWWCGQFSFSFAHVNFIFIFLPFSFAHVNFIYICSCQPAPTKPKPTHLPTKPKHSIRGGGQFVDKARWRSVEEEVNRCWPNGCFVSARAKSMHLDKSTTKTQKEEKEKKYIVATFLEWEDLEKKDISQVLAIHIWHGQHFAHCIANTTVWTSREKRRWGKANASNEGILDVITTVSRIA